MKAEEFLEIIRPDIGACAEIAYGTIPSDYTTGLPTVRFDGETAASGRRYPHLASYAPAANDRVMLMRRRGGTWVVVDKLISA
jgi:hypothetical protein